MAKVLFLADLNPNKFGSLEEMVLFLGRELMRRGDELIFCGLASPPPAIMALFSAAGIKVIAMPHPQKVKDKLFACQRIKFMRRLIREEGIDLVHINFYEMTSQVFWGAYLTGAKILFTEHKSGVPPIRGVLKGLVSKILHFFISMRVSKYIAVSNFVRERLRISHHVGPYKTVTIYNGVNVDRFIPRDRAGSRIATGLPLDQKIILSVAMLIPEKGLNYLIDAAAILVNDYGMKDLCVVIAGEGYSRTDLESQARDLQIPEHVIFLGRRSDIDQLIGAADLVVVPVVWAESYGLIIAESMAGERAVLASRIGGIPELIDDGKTGLLVEPGDAPVLCRAIERLLSDDLLREEIIVNARMKVIEKFNLSKQVCILTDLYRQTEKGEEAE